MARPFDHKGRFVTRDCPHPDCGGGRLQDQGGGYWTCDGLLDPGDDRELEACWLSHMDGTPYEMHVSP
jgi:hypothetical protein